MYVFRFVSFDFFWLYILHVPFLESHLEIIMVCKQNRCALIDWKPADSVVGIFFDFYFKFRFVGLSKKVCV